MILSSETSPNDAQQMLEFYKQHFAVVELVSCSKCGSMLAFECIGGDTMGLPVNELGKVIIPIGDALLSSRVRLDEAPTGERMMGYQCGAPVPNPDYAPSKSVYEKNLAKYNELYPPMLAKAQKAHEKAVQKAEKAGLPIPEFVEPDYPMPTMPNIPETIQCGNDTRIADAERGHVPVGMMQVALSPFEKHQIAQKIREDHTHKPAFKKVGNIKHFETFKVERL